MDIVAPAIRSRMMASVPQRNSRPELIVRQIAHSLGFRFRLHRRDLPGTPDIVFPRLRMAIFVHGCFWHRHGCRKTTTPTSNARFWQQKFDENRRRDRRAIRMLRQTGWKCIVIWECQTKSVKRLQERLLRFLATPLRN